jgi:apolipoprotein N-acyltransferase
MSGASSPGTPGLPWRRAILPHAVPDRFAFLWLAWAVVLFLFVGGPGNIALAAWLAPVFLLRVVRTQRLLIGLPLAWLARAVAFAFVLEGLLFYAGSGLTHYTLIGVIALVTTVPYAIDRLIAPRLGGFVATLVFPLAVTTVEYISSLGSTGNITSIAYTQYGELPLLQLASVTGTAGITFLVSWFAAVVNWAWERDFAWPRVRGGAVLYGAVLAAVILGGGARLALAAPTAATVRAAGISASQAAVSAFQRQLPPATLAALLSTHATAADRTAAHVAFSAIDADLLASTQREASAGAKVIEWPEASTVGANVLQEDLPDLLQRAGAVARQTGVYLDLGIAVIRPPGANPPGMDEAILIDPTGRVASTYEKTHVAPGDEGLFVIGTGTIPIVDTPYGRLATAICFDLDYVEMIRQVGQAGADLMLAPSDDWQSVDPAHSQLATFRAIENGFSLVRQTSRGLAIAVDYEGRVLAASDYFTTDRQAMVAYVPTHGVRTIYDMIGDLFAWLCIVGLMVLAGVAIVRPRSGAP